MELLGALCLHSRRKCLANPMLGGPPVGSDHTSAGNARPQETKAPRWVYVRRLAQGLHI